MLTEWVQQGPDLAEDGVVRWRLCNLRDRILARFFVVMDERSVGRILKTLTFSHSVRPRHPQADGEAQETHKKNFAALVAVVIPDAAQGKPIELWWQDEARLGQQGSLTRIWAKRGSRPTAPRDQRYECAYLFGAVCPARSIGAGLVLPHANLDAMNLHLQEISRWVSCDAFAVMTLDWCRPAPDQRLPGGAREYRTATPAALFTRAQPCREHRGVSATERPQQSGFATSEAIVDACCDAWNKLMAAPQQIKSIATRDWAKTVGT